MSHRKALFAARSLLPSGAANLTQKLRVFPLWLQAAVLMPNATQRPPTVSTHFAGSSDQPFVTALIKVARPTSTQLNFHFCPFAREGQAAERVSTSGWPSSDERQEWRITPQTPLCTMVNGG